MNDRNEYEEKKSAKNNTGFYIALAICIVTIAAAAWTTYGSVTEYRQKTAEETSSPASEVKVNNDVSGQKYESSVAQIPVKDESSEISVEESSSEQSVESSIQESVLVSEVSKVDDPELKLMVADSALQPFEELKHILDSLDRRGNLLGLVLFDTFFLSDFFLIRRFLRWRKHDLTAIDEWIGQVSVMDALVSMATFRYNEPAAAQAELVDSKELVYDASQIWHPFLGDKAVCNDFSIKHLHYYIVTGANMAGKSTFLRALGVNYVLALNGMPVFARGLRVSLYSLFTSMRTTDNLSRGISYFNAELLRLRQLIEECRRQGNTLIILDEILKGTNSLDKLNGSRLFLEEISKMAVTGVVATHDLGLSTLEDEHPDRFHNYCFEISLSDKITYTYKITAGVARNQNATYLLKGILKE